MSQFAIVKKTERNGLKTIMIYSSKTFKLNPFMSNCDQCCGIVFLGHIHTSKVFIQEHSRGK
jgi:hypothetical protein